MSQVFYWLRNKSVIDVLNRELKQSSCRGFYLQPSIFNDQDTRESYKESLQLINKEILLNFNYTYTLRPSLKSDENIRGKDYEKLSDKEKSYRDKQVDNKRQQLADLDELSKNKDAVLDLVEEKYDIYKRTKAFLESPLKRFDTPLVFFFGEIQQEPIKVLPFEFPYIALPPEEVCNKHLEIRRINNLCVQINGYLCEIQTNDSQYRESFFTLCLQLGDIIKQSKRYKDFITYISQFQNILVWIINLNEIYTSNSDVEAFANFLNLFKSFNNVIFKFSGTFSHRLIELTCEDYCSIIRLDGYPGQNINMLGIVKPTRKLLDPVTGSFLSVSSIGEFLTPEKNDDFDCDCSVCRKFEIDSYTKANELYLREDPEESPLYSSFIDKAEKTRHTKIRRIQNQNLLKHCFTNVEKNLRASIDDFRVKFNNSSVIFKKWKQYYYRRFNNDE